MKPMNKQQQIKKLTRKYFIQQKVKEILLFVLIALIGIFLPYYLGYWVVELLMQDEQSIFPLKHLLFLDWLIGLFTIIVSLGLIAVGFFIISEWFIANWKKAKVRAKKEVKETNK